ncbi:MAG: tetratricopeptide repeat protein [Gammaproteobacteria bacterium]|nr:tetratricopeptide repeat protein [Gammaproteobacteria bacterium]MBQ0840701.1 tetratricopeptide repeat protein [Gammaproteobacteria bacterium]
MNSQIDLLITNGHNEHLQGNADAAFKAYNEAFAIEPRNAQLNYHIGSLLMDEGDYGRACLFLESAVTRDPKNALFHLRLASVLFYLEDFTASAKRFEKALKLDKSLLSGWLGLGRCQRMMGNLVEAKRSFKTAIKRDSYATEALVELGFAYLDPEEVDTDKAQRYLEKADQLRPTFDSKLALLHIAATWKNRKRVLPVVKDALQYARSETDKLNILVATMDGLKIDTGIDLALYQLALAQFNQGDIDQAIDTLRKTLKARPKSINALISIAAYLSEKALYTEAESYFKAAFALLDKHPQETVELLYRHAIYLKQSGHLLAAKNELFKALTIDEGNCQVLYGLAVIAELMGQLDTALEHLDDALSIDPNNPEYSFEKALIQLSQGQFSSAWPLYLSRIPAEVGTQYLPHPFNAKAILPLPTADFMASGGNNSLQNTDENKADASRARRVCLLKEQGLGDQLFFLRFAPCLEAQQIEVVALVSPQLKTLLARSNGLSAVYTPEEFSPEEFEKCDSAIGMGDLPLICQHDSASSTPAPLTLIPGLAALTQVEELLANHPPPYLGLSWEVGKARQPGQANSLHEQLPLEELLRVVDAWTGSVVIIQQQPSGADLDLIQAQLGNKVLDLSRCNDELETMLALLTRLNHYVGVSNTNLQLYAGQGKPASVLVPASPDWRWMHEGEHSPWFPGFHVCRQTTDGSWKEAIASMQDHLYQ